MYVAHERRAYILKLLEKRGHVRSAQLAQELGVTDETIRTDLVTLQQKGLLERVHGGARYILPIGKGTDDALRPDCRMADILAGQIQAGMCLYLDDAPFSLVLAWRLREKPCCLVTAAPRLLTRLGADTLEHRLFCPGGEWEKASGLVAPRSESLDFLQSKAPDIAILRPDAVRNTSIGYRSATRAAWAEAALAAAKQCFIAVSADALAAAAPRTVNCTPDLLVTEDHVPAEMRDLPALRTIPYISRETLLPAGRFDY